MPAWFTGVEARSDRKGCPFRRIFQNQDGETGAWILGKAEEAGWWIGDGLSKASVLCPIHHTEHAAKQGLKSLYPPKIRMQRDEPQDGKTDRPGNASTGSNIGPGAETQDLDAAQRETDVHSSVTR